MIVSNKSSVIKKIQSIFVPNEFYSLIKKKLQCWNIWMNFNLHFSDGSVTSYKMWHCASYLTRHLNTLIKRNLYYIEWHFDHTTQIFNRLLKSGLNFHQFLEEEGKYWTKCCPMLQYSNPFTMDVLHMSIRSNEMWDRCV